jgi:hypothetical protein
VLTHLLGQSVEELGAKLALYRQAWREAGHPGEGRVTLMLHTLIGRDEAEVKELVRQPLIEYLRSSVDLLKGYAWSFPALKRRPGDDASGGALDLDTLTDQERESVLEYAFERYYETSGLFGTVDSCTARVDRLASIGVDEIACLIDFGVPTDVTLAHLEPLDQLRQRALLERPAAADQHGLAALVDLLRSRAADEIHVDAAQDGDAPAVALIGLLDRQDGILIRVAAVILHIINNIIDDALEVTA